MAKKTLKCKQCGGPMKKTRETKTGLGCLLFIIGLILLFFFPIGTIIGALIIVIGLVVGSQGKAYWVCRDCGYKIERQASWWEFI